VLDTAAWERVKFRCLAAIVREAKSHTTDVSVVTVCETVIDLCDRSAAGEVIPKEAWAAWASRAAAWASRAADGAAEASWAAKWAADAADGASRAAAKWAADAAALAAAAEAEAWDRMTSAILDAIEAETK
jgi:hypothetical protein